MARQSSVPTLGALAPRFAETREALHRVAEEIVAPARKPHNEIALRATPGGFGTPPFEHEGRRRQVRVEGPELVVLDADDERRAPITSLAAAAQFVGGELFPDGPPTETADLAVDAEAARQLGDLYAFSAVVLEELRSGMGTDMEPSEINLWPEHFDIAFEAGDERGGRRANYGVSPGDQDHSEPYVYVGPWNREIKGELWNATGFPGAELGYAELLDADDRRAAAMDFFEIRVRALTRPD